MDAIYQFNKLDNDLLLKKVKSNNFHEKNLDKNEKTRKKEENLIMGSLDFFITFNKRAGFNNSG